MKLLIKILFFILAIFQTDICIAKVAVIDYVVSEISLSNIFNSEKNGTEIQVTFLEDDLSNTCKSELDLVDYRNLMSVAKATATKGGASLLKPLGLGSTGRTTAANLVEQMAMKDAMANPQLGTRIMEGMKDTRWTGWTKMQYSVKTQNGVNAVVHYVGKWENGVLKAVDDFKFPH